MMSAEFPDLYNELGEGNKDIESNNNPMVIQTSSETICKYYTNW